MRSNSRQYFFSLFFVLGACASSPGPDTGTGLGSDAPKYPAGLEQSEEVMQPPAVVAAECDYTEQDDATNDYEAASGYMVEQSAISFDTTVQRTICGKINHGHFDNYWYSVDVDNYAVTMAQSGNVIVSFTGAAQPISSVGVYAYNVDLGKTQGRTYFIGDHGVFAGFLPAGNYEFSVEAYDDHDAVADIDYKLHINVDYPAQRCARVTTTPSYVESDDGANSTANDVLAIDNTAFPRYSMSSGSAELAGMTMSTGSRYRIQGVSDNVPQAGSYYDRDTYQVTTGPTTNQITMRLNWSGQSSDLDFFMFPQGQTFAIGAADHQQLGEDEFGTYPVVPNTTYWMTVAASAVAAAPNYVNYDASICAETFVSAD